MKESIRIVCISDLHGYLPADLPNGDILCITGDILPLDIQHDTTSSIAWMAQTFSKWAESLPYDRIFFVWGNHDFLGQFLYTNRHGEHRKPKEVVKKLLLPKHVVLLDDNHAIYEGFKFYGSPWCPNLSNWAFYKDSDGLNAAFKKIPNNIDVLLTHCAPMVEEYGVVLETGWNYLNNYGCGELAAAIKEKKPRLSIFGHIHSGNHVPRKIDDTVFCNCSIKSEDYLVAYDCKVFTLSKDHMHYHLGAETREIC